MKLPPFGLQLARMRGRGQHPERIWVIYGHDWSRKPNSGYAIFVKPEDAKPGVYKWSICAGILVHVVLQELDEAGYRLACDIGKRTAPVIVHWMDEQDVYQEDLANMAFANKWPWWTKRVEDIYLSRQEAYVAALRMRNVERHN